MNDYHPEHSADEEPVVGDAPPTDSTLLSNSVYDKLKFVTQVLLPGVGALYFALAGIWGLPWAEEIVGSIVALDAFLGLFLVGATKQYNNSDDRFDGTLQVERLPEGEAITNVLLDSSAVAGKDEITVKVDRV